MLELHGLPTSLRQEAERHKVELEKLLGKLAEAPRRRWRLPREYGE